MNLLPSLATPELVFRPRQLFLRWQRGRSSARAIEVVLLPWGTPLAIQPAEGIGRTIWRLGLFDLLVTETLWRLSDPGELAVDVGANIGHMTSALAATTGVHGRVWAFEPHPAVFQDLAGNLARWQTLPNFAQVTLYPLALSNQTGTAELSVPGSFDENRGRASLVPATDSQGQTLRIEVQRLDHLVATGDSIGVMKVDVEGAEVQVLQGAEGLVAGGRIRDVIFEDTGVYPTPVALWLEGRGFKVFSLRTGLWRPLVRPAGQPTAPLRSWESPSCLATLDPRRALARLQPVGWRCLK